MTEALAPHATITAALRVAPLRWQDEYRVADVLARAFVDDPLVIAICEGSRPQRQRRVRWNFRVAVRSHCLAEHPGWMMTDAGGVCAGAVLVTQSGAPVAARSDLLFALRSLLHVGLRTEARGLRAARTIARHLPNAPFTYLRTLGVAPEQHRRGCGSALVHEVIRRAPLHLPIYLETANERNLAFYRGHGFASVGTFECLDVCVWRLLRAPQERERCEGGTAGARVSG